MNAERYHETESDTFHVILTLAFGVWPFLTLVHSISCQLEQPFFNDITVYCAIKKITAQQKY